VIAEDGMPYDWNHQEHVMLFRNSVRPALERLGLLEFFIATVTAEDGMETKSQRFLSAAIKLGRPPNHCVVFDSCLAGVTAAHNCTMKVLGLKSHQSLLALC